jgi:hypothetical protein
MASFWIVPAFYPFEDGVGEFVAGKPFFRVEQLKFHGPPERLHHRVVVAITDCAHRGEQSGGAESLTERPRGVLRALLRCRVVGTVGGSVASVEDKIRSWQAEVMRRRRVRVPAPRSSFAGFRFPPEVIMVAVRWYLRYGLSYRDVEELLAERGIAVDHVTVYRWVQRLGLLHL